MKRIIKIIAILCTLLFITSCSKGEINNDPEVSLRFDISNLTDEEFQSVGTKGLENATKSDFKNIEFTLDISHSNKISNRNIVIPDIEKIANSYDRERYWFGESYSQDNSQEKFAKYGNKFVFYSKGLDEQAIKDIFNLSEIKIAWTRSADKNEEKVFKLSEIINFR